MQDTEYSDSRTCVEDASPYGEIDFEIKKAKGIYLGVVDEEEDANTTEGDDLEDIWNELSMTLALTKVSFRTAVATIDRGERPSSLCHLFILYNALLK